MDKLFLTYGKEGDMQPEACEEHDNVSVLVGRISELLNQPEPPEVVQVTKFHYKDMFRREMERRRERMADGH